MPQDLDTYLTGGGDPGPYVVPDLGFDLFGPGDVGAWRKVLRENDIRPEADCEGCDGIGIVLDNSRSSLSIWDFCECVVDEVNDLSRCPNDPEDCDEPGCTCDLSPGETRTGYIRLPGVNYSSEHGYF